MTRSIARTTALTAVPAALGVTLTARTINWPGQAPRRGNPEQQGDHLRLTGISTSGAACTVRGHPAVPPDDAGGDAPHAKDDKHRARPLTEPAVGSVPSSPASPGTPGPKRPASTPATWTTASRSTRGTRSLPSAIEPT
ncbi:hypothetical protein V2W30_36700 [Streptomyces sp. Q6]|uniref:Uncharacterized protein n=1 Tax=Streptomyces citrinus TaxID=3118173 RepID=A0ACD5AM36_9ACTN